MPVTNHGCGSNPLEETEADPGGTESSPVERIQHAGADVTRRAHVRGNSPPGQVADSYLADSAARGTSRNASTSTRPWSVSFRLGITDSARNESVRNGVASVHPSRPAASLQARLCSTTSARGASESRPATGNGSSAFTP